MFIFCVANAYGFLVTLLSVYSNPLAMLIMAKHSIVSILVFLLDISLVSPSMGYICSNDASSPPDTFEEHGCLCGTNQTSFSYPSVFHTYPEAFSSCHEDDSDDGDLTIECAFIQEEALLLKEILNRTLLSEIPVVTNGAQIYRRIRCL